MNILVISSNYPSTKSPQVGAFVYEIIQEFVNQGNRVTVISPTKMRFFGRVNKSYGEERATVLRPSKISFSNKDLFFFNTFHLSSFFEVRSIRRSARKIAPSADVIYCHFIISCIHYLKAFPKSPVPVYVAVGEYQNLDIIRNYFSVKEYSKFLEKVTGFIAVSEQIEHKLLSYGVPKEKIIIEPNGTNLEKFKPRNKKETRQKLDLPLNEKIVLFVGRFIENKGPLRVQDALLSLPNGVVSIFIGSGDQQPIHPNIIFSGPVSHQVVAEFMSSADVFVLPTLHEGSSNVIIEAMACGLPIVSSDIPEISAICKPSFSILINPKNVKEISEALTLILTNHRLREEYSVNAIQESKKYDLTSRARRILVFMQK